MCFSSCLDFLLRRTNNQAAEDGSFSSFSSNGAAANGLDINNNNLYDPVDDDIHDPVEIQFYDPVDFSTSSNLTIYSSDDGPIYFNVEFNESDDDDDLLDFSRQSRGCCCQAARQDDKIVHYADPKDRFHYTFNQTYD